MRPESIGNKVRTEVCATFIILSSTIRAHYKPSMHKILQRAKQVYCKALWNELSLLLEPHIVFTVINALSLTLQQIKKNQRSKELPLLVC